MSFQEYLIEKTKKADKKADKKETKEKASVTDVMDVKDPDCEKAYKAFTKLYVKKGKPVISYEEAVDWIHGETLTKNVVKLLKVKIGELYKLEPDPMVVKKGKGKKEALNYIDSILNEACVDESRVADKLIEIQDFIEANLKKNYAKEKLATLIVSKFQDYFKSFGDDEDKKDQALQIIDDYAVNK